MTSINQIFNYKFALVLPPTDLINICQHDPSYASILHDEKFWEEKTIYDYEISFLLSSKTKWEQLYLDLYQVRAKIYEIYLDHAYIGTSYWYVNDQSFDSSLNMFLKKYNLDVEYDDYNLFLFDDDDKSLGKRPLITIKQELKYDVDSKIFKIDLISRSPPM
jgi:hypothetical protein